VDRGAVDWAAVRVGDVSWEDLDPLEFERLRQLAGSSGTGADSVLASLSDREIASALGLVRSDADVTAGACCGVLCSPAVKRTGGEDGCPGEMTGESSHSCVEIRP
jgi:hypothetical protein